MEYSIAYRRESVDLAILHFINAFCKEDLSDNEFNNLARLLTELCEGSSISSSSAYDLLRYVASHAKHEIPRLRIKKWAQGGVIDHNLIDSLSDQQHD
jgi:hypothetical protein